MKVFNTIITAVDPGDGKLKVFKGKPVCAESRATAQARLHETGLGYMEVVDDGDAVADEFGAILSASLKQDHVHLQ